MRTAVLKFAFVWVLCALAAVFLGHGPFPNEYLYLRHLSAAFLGFVGAAGFMVVSLLWNDRGAGPGSRRSNMMKFGGAWLLFAALMLLLYKTGSVPSPHGGPSRISGSLQIQVSALVGFIGAALSMAAYLAWKRVARGNRAASGV